MPEKYQYVIGMDCGTTNIKAVVLRSDGKVVASASRSNTFQQPGPDMQEQDPEGWWLNSCSIFRELISAMDPEEIQKIKGICISSHTVSLLAVDAEGNVLRPAMTYQDSRSSVQLQKILQTVGKDRFINIVGGRPSVAFLPSKLMWFRENEPELFAKTACLLQASSYIVYKLTDVMTGDIDQALRTQCMDICTQEWSEEIGDAIGVDLKQIMPQICQIDDIIGYVTETAAQQSGLVQGIPVLAGCSDAMASMYATGLNRLGDAGESSGTTSLVFVGSDVPSTADVPVTTRPCAIDGVPWVYDAPIQSSGASLKWFIEKFGAEEQLYAKEHGINIYDYLNELAEKGTPGSGGLLFFPYLMGERAPLWNDYASGMFIGMRMNMHRCDLVRSIFEGTAFALRHVIETVKQSGAKAKLLRICGGGSRSRTWNKIKASMLNMPVYVMSSDSGDVPVGDALIAGNKTGIFPDLTKAVQQVLKVEEVIEPVPEWTAVYDKLYPYYTGMYKALESELKSIHESLREIEGL